MRDRLEDTDKERDIVGEKDPLTLRPRNKERLRNRERLIEIEIPRVT